MDLEKPICLLFCLTLTPFCLRDAVQAFDILSKRIPIVPFQKAVQYGKAMVVNSDRILLNTGRRQLINDDYY